MFKVWIRKRQYYNTFGQPIYWVGQNPNALSAQQGYIPNNTWIDATDDVSNIDTLALTFTEWRNREGEEVPGVNFIKKTSSSALYIEGAAYVFIREWLIDHVAAPLNNIDVVVEDTVCGVKYDEWVISRGQINFCEDGICQFDVTMQQADEPYHCIQKTLINDNWQGWFQNQPANGKKHPRFSYCNEIRPNGSMVMQWYVALSSIASGSIFMFPMILLLNSIFFAINGVIAIINAASSLLGGSSTAVPYIQFLDPNAIWDGMAQMFLEHAGCGREHPAPLIRDYIFNVCKKCGIEVDSTSFPVLFGQNIFIETASGIQNTQNPYYNACLFHAPIARGIRRFRNINLLNGYTDLNQQDYFIIENSPDIALSDFLDDLKRVFNSEWRIKRVNGVPYLYFWRRDWYLDSAPLYDFTANGADRIKILEGVCFEAREIKFPATVDGLYVDDPVDTCGNEAMRAMNGFAYSFDDSDNNPNFEGRLETKNLEFSATKFRLDGHAKDYLFDAAQVVLGGSAIIFLSTSLINPFSGLIIGLIFKGLMSHCRDYADYALLLKDETASNSKILIWDGESYENAKCIKSKKAHPDGADPRPQPTPDGVFNSQRWDQLHAVETFVRGQNLSFANTPKGNYVVKDYFGVQYTKQPAMLVNYPMYFNPAFRGTLWDWFWWIDDPRRHPRLGLSWSVKIELCCDDLKKTGAINDASELQIGNWLKVPAKYYQEGIIREIIVSYSNNAELGKFIELKGEI